MEEDTGFTGSQFTWTNGHTWRRRVVSNAQWSNYFLLFRVTHLNRTASDHSPLLLSCDKNVARGPSRFKFLHAWIKHPSFLDVVRQPWISPVLSSRTRAFQQKLARLKLYLKIWNKDIFCNVFHWVKEAEEDVAKKKRQYDIHGSVVDRAIFSEARVRLQHALLCEESFLRQQFIVRWVWEGDANTGFFHAMIQKKCQLFLIHQIQDAFFK